MKTQSFMDRLHAKWDAGSFLTLSLNPRCDMMPPFCTSLMDFISGIIEATRDYVCSFQIDPAFYHPFVGTNAENFVSLVIARIRQLAPTVPVIADLQMAGNEDRIQREADMWFGQMNVEAVTVCPYHGRTAFLPSLQWRNKGVVINCRTTGDDEDEFQDAIVNEDPPMPFHRHVAWRVSQYWNHNSNCALAIGANHARNFREIRDLITQADRPVITPFFIYGVSLHGLEHLPCAVREAVVNGKDSNDIGFSIVVSRTLLHASRGRDCFTAANHRARMLSDTIAESRKITVESFELRLKKQFI